MKDNKKLVVFRCPNGHAPTTAFLAPGVPAFSICDSLLEGMDENGMPNRCNSQKIVVVDERPLDERGKGPLQQEILDRIRVVKVCQMAIGKVRDLSQSAGDIVREMGIGLKGIKKS